MKTIDRRLHLFPALGHNSLCNLNMKQMPGNLIVHRQRIELIQRRHQLKIHLGQVQRNRHNLTATQKPLMQILYNLCHHITVQFLNFARLFQNRHKYSGRNHPSDRILPSGKSLKRAYRTEICMNNRLVPDLNPAGRHCLLQMVQNIRPGIKHLLHFLIIYRSIAGTAVFNGSTCMHCPAKTGNDCFHRYMGMQIHNSCLERSNMRTHALIDKRTNLFHLFLCIIRRQNNMELIRIHPAHQPIRNDIFQYRSHQHKTAVAGIRTIPLIVPTEIGDIKMHKCPRFLCTCATCAKQVIYPSLVYCQTDKTREVIMIMQRSIHLRTPHLQQKAIACFCRQPADHGIGTATASLFASKMHLQVKRLIRPDMVQPVEGICRHSCPCAMHQYMKFIPG